MLKAALEQRRLIRSGRLVMNPMRDRIRVDGTCW